MCWTESSGHRPVQGCYSANKVPGGRTRTSVIGMGSQQDAHSGSCWLAVVPKGSVDELSEECMQKWSCSWPRMLSSLLLLMGFSTKRSIPQSSQGLSAPSRALSGTPRTTWFLHCC